MVEATNQFISTHPKKKLPLRPYNSAARTLWRLEHSNAIVRERELLSRVLHEVRKRGVNPELNCRCSEVEPGQWEFQGPDDFAWIGSADDAHQAIARGWHAWLEEESNN